MKQKSTKKVFTPRVRSTRRRTPLRNKRPVRRGNRGGRKSVAPRELQLAKSKKNPILVPRSEHAWESRQTFNAAALFEGGKVHLFYRALGEDGVSRIGYAASRDGIHIDERVTKPIYSWREPSWYVSEPSDYFYPYISGGGLGGTEDPRVTKINGRVYMIYVAFDGYHPPRLALTSIALEDFSRKNWKWSKPRFLSSPDKVTKSGCVFPEKINDRYVIMHRVFPDILIDFAESLDFKEGHYLQGQHKIKPRKGYWDSRKIGAGAPPIKTKQGWLLIYYGVDDRDASQYKIGAMLLDLKNPTKVIARTNQPILEPYDWYENSGHKAGVAYPCGAVVIEGKLFVYYGGADTVVCVATADLKMFVDALLEGKTPQLTNVSVSAQ